MKTQPQQRIHERERDAGDDAGVEAVREDATARPPARRALVGVAADQHAGDRRDDEDDRLDRHDQLEGDRDHQRHADADPPGEDRSLVDEPGGRARPRRCRRRRRRSCANLRATVRGIETGRRGLNHGARKRRSTELTNSWRLQHARVDREPIELGLDAQQLVVLGDALAAGRRAGLDLAGAGRDGEVGDRRVLRLAAAMADRPCPSRCAGPVSTTSSVSVSVPIWLTLTRIALALPSSMPRARRSALVTKRSSPTSWTFLPSSLGQQLPAVPVVLGQAVLERADRVLRRPSRPRGRPSPRRQRAAFLAPGR